MRDSKDTRDSPSFRRTISPEPIIDHSSNVRVSSIKPAASRRDSWDVINKTKHMFSNNSLESLANLTEKQLNTDLSYRRNEIENETQRNTQYNKFALNDDSEQRERYKPTSTSVNVRATDSYNNSMSGVPKTGFTSTTSTVKESSERYVTERSGGDYDLYSTSKFRPLDSKATGASAIRVQDIANGALGRPVEFEIDGSRAGSGNLEILVNGGRVTSSVRSLGGQRFIASFTPHESGIHTVQITFNGETVPGKCDSFSFIT